MFNMFTKSLIKNEKLEGWVSKHDGSLNSGGEIASPIMTDEEKYWNELKKICKYLTKKNVDMTHNAGGHTHIGINALGQDAETWRVFLKLYATYEHILFRFGYGDKINARRGIFEYAKPIAEEINRIIPKLNEKEFVTEIKKILPYNKYQALNFQNLLFYNKYIKTSKNTIEFRFPNATSNEVIWQNYINAFTKMITSSRNKKIDEEYLDYKLKKEYIPFSENQYLYSTINLKDVLEFVDIVFNNNLDKIYFLRQYLKDYKEVYNCNQTIYSKKFVR